MTPSELNLAACATVGRARAGGGSGRDDAKDGAKMVGAAYRSLRRCEP